jgi:hypothetical protein
MKDTTTTEKPVSNWAVAGGLLVFAALYLVWALGFDSLAQWLAGGTIEKLLNWVSNAWYWVVMVAVVIAVVLGSWMKRPE